MPMLMRCPYEKARRGELANFTGIDSTYEASIHPEVHLDTATAEPEDSALAVIGALRARGIVS